MGKARLKGEGGARRGRRRLGAIAGIARRLESGSRKGPPTAQSTAIAAAWARRKLVSMTWAPVRRSAIAERRASAEPAAAAASIATAVPTKGGSPAIPPKAPPARPAAKVPTDACPSPPRLKAPALKAMQAPKAQARRGAEDSRRE